MKHLLATAFATALMCCSVPVLVAAQTPPSPTPGPIRIDSCDVKGLAGQTGMGNLFVNGHDYNFFNITFTNTASVVATDVTFQVDFSKSRYVLDDAGSFAAGGQVTHHLRDHGKSVQALARPATEDTATTQCSVLAVHFADGTSWTRPTS
jgi:hypothetical protein